MLNISDLEEISTKRNAINGYSIKRLTELISRKDNVERIFYILRKQDIINSDLTEFIEQVETKGITTTIKSVGAWKTTGARHTKTSWANPYVWMLLALEMSPEIYGEAAIWLGDSLIMNRIEAGNMYRGLTSSVNKFKNVDWATFYADDLVKPKNTFGFNADKVCSFEVIEHVGKQNADIFLQNFVLSRRRMGRLSLARRRSLRLLVGTRISKSRR